MISHAGFHSGCAGVMEERRGKVGLGDRTGEREWKKREEGERSCCKGKRGKKEIEEKEGKEEECGEGWNVGIEGRKIFPQSFGSTPFSVKMRV
jgi:hypothetical protein